MKFTPDDPAPRPDLYNPREFHVATLAWVRRALVQGGNPSNYHLVSKVNDAITWANAHEDTNLAEQAQALRADLLQAKLDAEKAPVRTLAGPGQNVQILTLDEVNKKRWGPGVRFQVIPPPKPPLPAVTVTTDRLVTTAKALLADTFASKAEAVEGTLVQFITLMLRDLGLKIDEEDVLVALDD